MEGFILFMVFIIGYSAGQTSARIRFEKEQEEKAKAEPLPNP
jgi:hypothetical protein